MNGSKCFSSCSMSHSLYLPKTPLETSKTRLALSSLMELKVALSTAGGWTGRPLKVPSNPDYSMILWFCLSFIDEKQQKFTVYSSLIEMNLPNSFNGIVCTVFLMLLKFFSCFIVTHPSLIIIWVVPLQFVLCHCPEQLCVLLFSGHQNHSLNSGGLTDHNVTWQ